MKGRYYTFIVRIHSESGNNFRGYIQHIRTQEQVHFDSFEDMKTFMEKHLANRRAPPQDNPAA